MSVSKGGICINIIADARDFGPANPFADEVCERFMALASTWLNQAWSLDPEPGYRGRDNGMTPRRFEHEALRLIDNLTISAQQAFGWLPEIEEVRGSWEERIAAARRELETELRARLGKHDQR